MLKFEFDNEKHEIFLNFWKIKKISDFHKLAENPNLFFLRLSALNDIALKSLGYLVATMIGKEKIKDYTHYPSPPPSKDIIGEEGYEEILDMLDSINLINRWNSNTEQTYHPLNPSPKGREKIDLASYHLTPEFESCVIKFAHPPFHDAPPTPKAGVLDELSQESRKALSRFVEFYGFYNNQILPFHSEAILLDLQHRGLIDFFFLPNAFTPAVVVNPNILSDWHQGSSEKKTVEKAIPFPKEMVAESMFFLQVLKFEQVGGVSLPKYYPTSQDKKDFLIDLFQTLMELPRRGMFYSTVDLTYKITFLLQHCLPQSYRFLEFLLSWKADEILGDLEGGLEEWRITHEVNRRAFHAHQSDQAPFPSAAVKSILHNLTMLGLLHKRNQVYYGDRELLEKLLQVMMKTNDPATPTPAADHEKTDVIVIDSDYSLIATKEQVATEDIFFLLHFCSLKISSYLIRGQLDTEKSSLAWYYGINQNTLLDFFRDRSENSWQENFQQMLELYFEHSPYFRTSSTIKITTPSLNFFLMLKYFLDEKGFLSQVTILEKEKTFLFHDHGVFEKLKAAFPDPPPINIFEED